MSNTPEETPEEPGRNPDFDPNRDPDLDPNADPQRDPNLNPDVGRQGVAPDNELPAPEDPNVPVDPDNPPRSP